MPSGALRKDLPKGNVPVMDVLDSFPFTDLVAELDMSGEQIIRVLEQSLTLERGMLQVSGLQVEYDLSKPTGHRVISVLVNGITLQQEKFYHVATIEIMAQGGDLYSTFKEAIVRQSKKEHFSKVLTKSLQELGNIVIPQRGRLIPLS